MKRIFITALMLFPLCAAFAEPMCKPIRKDNTAMSFIPDQQAVGYWRAIDFVDKIEDFDRDNINFKEDLYLKDLIFYRGGGTSVAFRWTNGYVIHDGDSTAARYIIKAIPNSMGSGSDEYMFLEWKSGDYVCRGLAPKYYVFKKIASPKEDNIDMKFVNDKAVLGNWTTVDFVDDPSQFTPGEKYWKEDLFLKKQAFLPKGKMLPPFTKWTKGLIINQVDKTASAYKIEKIDGKEYMFREWKSGDYVYRGMKPSYYVLERE